MRICKGVNEILQNNNKNNNKIIRNNPKKERKKNDFFHFKEMKNNQVHKHDHQITN